MKPVYKCDYCSHIGTEEDVKEHEIKCTENYDRRSCYTCKYKGKLTFKDCHLKYECNNGKDIPEDSIIEFCNLYEKKEEENKDNKNPYYPFFDTLFGRNR